MQTFIVHGKNQAGELAKLTGALGTKGVNVLITALGVEGQGMACFVASDETAAQAALKEAGFDFKMLPTLTVRMNDKPGQAAEISRLLSDQGVNIECFLPISVTDDKVIAAIADEDIDVDRKALGEVIVEFVYS